MDIDVVSVLREALSTLLIVTSPILVVSLVVGLLAGFLQAATQIQDQALSFIPKLVSIVVVVSIVLPWLIDRMVAYSASMFSSPMGL